jgi:HK97 family phage portal protein
MSKVKQLYKAKQVNDQPPKKMGRGQGPSTPFLDHYRNLRKPSIFQLIESYKRTVFACANINAAGCSRVPLKLYVKTSGGDKPPRVATKQIKNDQIDYLSQNYLRKSVKNIEEVPEHPILDALYQGNQSIWLNGFQLTLLTQLYLEIVGRCYWFVKQNLFGLPNEFWIVPSYLLEPKTEIGSKAIVDYYELTTGSEKEKIPVEQIIQFLMPNLVDPYAGGKAPNEAGFESSLIGNKLVSHENAILDNRARIDVLVSPDKDSSIGADEARRLEKELIQRFSRGNFGLYVAEEALNIEPLTYAPSDVAQLQIYDQSKQDVANVFGVPYVLIDSKNISKATLEAALTQHAMFTLDPRLKSNAAVLNDRIVKEYDETGRLFLAYDNPVPQDKTAWLQETVQLVMNGIATPNEGRDRHNLPPHSGDEADKLRPINVAANANSNTKRENSRGSGSAKK